jgi:hypothetical protein
MSFARSNSGCENRKLPQIVGFGSILGRRSAATAAVMRGKIALFSVALAFGIGGCFSPDPKSIKSDNAASAVPAIKDAADAGDRTAIPRLIDDLDDNDPAIRFAAITALQKMTGQSFDYNYYDDAPDRQAAVQRWRQWLAEQPKSAHP